MSTTAINIAALANKMAERAEGVDYLEDGEQIRAITTEQRWNLIHSLQRVFDEKESSLEARRIADRICDAADRILQQEGEARRRQTYECRSQAVSLH